VADDFKAKVIAYENERLNFRRQLAAITQTNPRSVTKRLKNLPSQKGLIPVKLVMIGDGAVGKVYRFFVFTSTNLLIFPFLEFLSDYIRNKCISGIH